MASTSAPIRSDAAGEPMEQPALPSGERVPPASAGPDTASTSLGALLVVAADAMVLAGIVAAYFAVKDGSAAWPPKGVSVGTYIPTMVTITAVMASFSVQWGLFATRRNDQRNAAIAMVMTVFFGVAIANAEWLAFTRAGFGVSAHSYGTFYYLLVGYHLVHMLAATALLVLVTCRALAGHFSRSRHEPVRAATIFFHYTNAVWFVVVTVLFLLSKNHS
jgi:heme/copper-type cytochrome/quinol oxidase subunit 3